MNDDDEIPAFVIRGVAPQDDLSGGWVPEGEPDVEADDVEDEEPVGGDDGGDRPD